MKLGFVVLIVFVLTPWEAYSDEIPPSHACSQPHKPALFFSEAEAKSFNAAVQQYKNCISEYVEEQKMAMERHQQIAEKVLEEQKAAMEQHRQAGEKAIAEWNSFLNQIRFR